MNRYRNIAAVLTGFVLLCICLPVYPQSATPLYEKISVRDIGLTSVQDTIKDKPVVKNFKMRKNPWVAVGLSAVLPGAGQYYNKSYWKIPVIAAIGGYLGYVIVKNNNDFIDFRESYRASQTAENPAGDPVLKAQREFYRDQRDQFILYGALLYLINLVDAYVDAHLYDFDVSESVNFGVVGKGKLMELKVSF